MAKNDLSYSVIEPVSISDAAETYIMRNSHLEALLFNRNLIGLDFTRECEAASRAFLRHLEPELLPMVGDTAELMVLSKGMYYWMHNAYAQVFGQNLQTNFVATSRSSVTENAAMIDLRYFNCDAPAENLIIGETVASGDTLCAVISRYLEVASLQRVFIFAIAGTATGGRKVAELCEAHGVKCTIVYGLAAFGLGKNGFDLSFLHPDTITSPIYRERAHRVFYGRPVSAPGWDFGSQAQSPRKYKALCWVEAKYWGLEDTDVFSVAEAPDDIRLIAKEHDAFRERFPLLSDIRINRHAVMHG